MKTNSHNNSVSAVYRELRRQIECGCYAFGERLPGGLELSRQLNASYVTMVKCLKQLAAEGFVECRRGVGNFVRYIDTTSRPVSKKVNIICEAFEHLDYTTFINESQRLFQASGWEVRVHRFHHNIEECIQLLNSPDYYSVIFATPPDINRMKALVDLFRERVVVIGDNSCDDCACITCDESLSVQLCMDHLASLGRTRTGKLFPRAAGSVFHQSYAAWLRCMRENGLSFCWCNEHCFDMHLNFKEEKLQEYADRYLDNLIASGSLKDLDSIIVHWPEAAVMLIEKCRQHGIRVPEDLAVITCGNNGDLQNSNTSLTYLDSNIAAHVAIAADILNARWNGQNCRSNTYYCTPILFPGGSTGC